MPHAERVLSIRKESSATGTAEKVLRTDRVPRGELWRVTHWAFEDETSGFTEARVFVEQGNSRHLLYEEKGGLAASLYFSDEPILLGEGEVLAVAVTGSASADKLQLYVRGVRILDEEA